VVLESLFMHVLKDLKRVELSVTLPVRKTTLEWLISAGRTVLQDLEMMEPIVENLPLMAEEVVHQNNVKTVKNMVLYGILSVMTDITMLVAAFAPQTVLME
jgi:hypothetical protein